MLVCKNLKKIFVEGNESICILDDINFNISKGETVSIIGSSGSGKSTLLHVLSSLEKADSGEILLDDSLITSLTENELCAIRLNKIGFIYQFHHLIKELNVKENIALPLIIKGEDVDDIESKTNDIIDQVGLSERKNYQIDKLSGGERQRVAIARAVVHKPKIIFADEPTGNLDKVNANNIFSLLKDLVNYNQSSLIMATHDLDIAVLLDKKYSIQNGDLIKIKD
tara:strand:+ start:929 stop:1603 length:675 start_codon:yes stop_codon:yes gene_type:complete